jgi:tetratricopeptide (TPR) repeat protein
MKALALFLWAGLALAQTERWQAFEQSTNALNAKKAQLSQIRASEPQRWASEMRAALDKREAEVKSVDDMANVAIPARMALASDYNALAGFLRFAMRQPDAAMDAYEAAFRVQPADSLDIASLGIADIARFDKRDNKTAVERYKRTLFSVSGRWSGPNAELASGFKRWLGAEVAYLERGERWSGSIERADLALANLWLLLTSRQEPLPRGGTDAEILAQLTPSQLQLGRVYPALLLFPPDEMLGIFGKHDPAGYLTASILALSLQQDPSPYVKSAAARFFRERAIRPPSGKMTGT